MKKRSSKKISNLEGTLDFETDPFLYDRVPMPFACGIWFGEDHPLNAVVWGDNCAAAVADYLRELPECTLYAHNGGKFDFYYLFDFANKESVRVVNGRVLSFKIGRVKLIDSFPLMPFPLAAYQKTKINYEWFEREKREKHKQKIIEYLIDDCRDLLNLIKGFKEVSGDKTTIGAAAMAQIKLTGVNIHRQQDTHDEKFRLFYYGGRCQAFRVGVFKENLKYYDINSAYPYAMTHDHAHGNYYAIGETLPKKAGPWFAVIDAVSRGALPMRENGKLLFPNDGLERTYYATGWEIIAALETDSLDISRIREVLLPMQTINFNVFVKTFFKKRAEAKKSGDKIKELAYKYLLNSGYGKFAQDGRKFREYAFYERGQFIDGWELESDFGKLSLWSRPAPDPFGFYDVATGASITGFVRAMLWRAIASSKKPLYCDTDSVICESADIPISNDLGHWKLEGGINFAAVAGKKLYAVRGPGKFKKIASKGVRLTFDEIVSIARGEAKTWKNPAPTFNLKKPAFFVKRKIVAKR